LRTVSRVASIGLALLLPGLGVFAVSCQDDQCDGPNNCRWTDDIECLSTESGCDEGEKVYYCAYDENPNPPFQRPGTYRCAVNYTDALYQCPGTYDGQSFDDAQRAICEGLSIDTDGSNWEPRFSIEYNSSQDVYEIEEAFWYDVLEDPTPLLWDGARAEPKDPYYKLYDVDGGDAADLLGLGNGDKILRINDILRQHDNDIVEAVHSLADETDFELLIYKWPDGNRTQYYTIVE
jgi:hypothetical protein